MFGFGSFSHILVVLILALILIGPKQLPEVARTIGRLLAELRRASNGFQDQINAQMRELDHQNMIRPDQDQHEHHNQQPYHQSESYSLSEEQPQIEQQLELQPQQAAETEVSESSAQTQSENESDEKKS